MLAALYDRIGEYAKAIERYRAALALSPNSPVGLNELAYALAVRAGQPREALPLAQRAYALSAAEPGVVDTLAWIHHLLDNDVEAARLMSEITKQDTGVGSIHLHAAVVFDAVGRRADATRELDRATKSSPDLADDENVIRLRARLKEPR
jgi:Flp pilus assembly protein TadD